jgi:hypothetical protein
LARSRHGGKGHSVDDRPPDEDRQLCAAAPRILSAEAWRTRDTAWGSAICNVDNGQAVVIDAMFNPPPVARIETAAPTGMRGAVGTFSERAGAFNAPIVALPTVRTHSKTASVKR